MAGIQSGWSRTGNTDGGRAWYHNRRNGRGQWDGSGCDNRCKCNNHDGSRCHVGHPDGNLGSGCLLVIYIQEAQTIQKEHGGGEGVALCNEDHNQERMASGLFQELVASHVG